MTQEAFSAQDFAHSIATQAMEVPIADFTEEQKQFVINKLYNISIFAGQTLVADSQKDEEYHFNSAQITLIVQYTAEWVYHKTIDSIRANIAADNLEEVVNKIAFASFQAAKAAIQQDFAPQNITDYVEDKVTQAYEAIIKEKALQGVIPQEKVSEILGESNLSKVVAQVHSDKPANLSSEDHQKIIKYSSLALLMKSVSPEHKERIMKSLDQEQIESIQPYIKEENPTKNVKYDEVKDSLDELNEIVSERIYSPDESYIELIRGLLENFTDGEIINTVKNERKEIVKFVKFALEEEPTKDMFVELSPQVSSLIYNFIRAKLSV